MDQLQYEALRAAESMKLFERDGIIHMEPWRQWYRGRYDKEEAQKILDQFKATAP
jgi:hypothetical protein